jgi:hypothetical protein
MITPEPALKELRHTGCLHLVGPVREQAMETLK